MPNKKRQKRRNKNNDEDETTKTEIEEELEIAQISFDSMTSEAKCDMIAEISEEIMQDPTKAFVMERKRIVVKSGDEKTLRLPSRMQKLLDLGRVHKNGNDEYIATLAIMSILALFQDIVPSYRIRPPTDAEQSSKVAKETKQLWDYERGLLTHYQQFLQLLEKVWKTSGGGGKPSPVATTAILTASELVKSAYHFNFRSNIITMVVKQMNNRHSEQVSTACCDAVSYIFEHDAQGDVALETSRMVAKLIREYKGSVRESVLRTFAKLPLRVHIDEAIAAKLATSANKKKRRRDKELAEIEGELQEGSAGIDKIMLARCQSETLQTVVLTYFRILKSHESELKRELLPPALEGLAKFAHLINIDTVIDLLDILKKLLADVDTLPLEAALNCILTAFQTLQGPGKEMNIDIKEYIAPLYKQITRLVTESNSSKANTDIVLDCLAAAFLKRREYSMTRVSAFVKQMLAVSMHAPSHTSIPLMALARQILQRYPAIHQMFDNEQDVITSGQEHTDVDDPEQSNPFSSSAWAVANLKFHLDPAIADQAKAAGALKMLQMPAEDPSRLRKGILRDNAEVYTKYRRNERRHPLIAKSRTQIRFITARKRASTMISHEE
mmetsp:Transcript_17399/g.49076  ORF Transcript_17399/g.49076 Transcript_17399/m.49076 type:complete len:612 (-) Transcript_17399:255-2090(-)|eukprot:CAMPEP_0119557078 /NCGR_PEP_ID=MMETSP1352-20130426/8851_1 /TAXON_ID=265584 /ORGANISM="Stauroneis constricta, Strain CCMP1120" /LENGTH=611 /DNA_ID=CAMNT_0007604121 /DNA_START=110 /DNA_END=1945 /DNA_ORIENTATION=+